MSSGALSSVEQRKLLRMITFVILRLQSTQVPNGVTAGNCKCVTAKRHRRSTQGQQPPCCNQLRWWIVLHCWRVDRPLCLDRCRASLFTRSPGTLSHSKELACCEVSASRIRNRSEWPLVATLLPSDAQASRNRGRRSTGHVGQWTVSLAQLASYRPLE